VSTRANSSSFQLKMKQIREVAAMPGRTIGATICRSVRMKLTRMPVCGCRLTESMPRAILGALPLR